MSKIFPLTKVLIKTSLFSQFSASERRKDKKKIGKGLKIFLMGLFILFIFASTLFPMGYSAYGLAKDLNLDNIIISLVVPVAGITTIFFGIFSIISVFYMNKSTQSLLHLPIKSKDLLMSNFIIALISNYFLLIIFVLPFLIGVGIGIEAGFMYYLYATLIFVLIPIIPSVIVCIIVMLLTSFFNIAKYKDRFMYISTLLVVTVSLAYSFGAQYLFSSSLMENLLNGTFGDLDSLIIPYTRKLFPFLNSASDTLLNYKTIFGLFSFITFVGFNLIALVFLYLVGDKLYLKGITKSVGVPQKKTLTKKQVYKNINNNGLIREMLRKDWLIIKRTPIYMLNLVIVTFITLIIVLVSMMASMSGGEEALSIGVGEGTFQNPVIYLGAFIALLFFSSMSQIAATSISREGQNAWFMKTIPVDYVKQINIKVLLAVIFDIISIMIVGGILIFLFRPPIIYSLSLLVPLIIVIFIQNYLSILIDLKRPRLKWANEQEAVKQNLNVLFGMVVTLVFCLLLGALIFLISLKGLAINVYIISGVLTLLFSILLILVLSYIRNKKNQLFDKIS